MFLIADQINYKRYGRKRALSSSTDNRVDAVATKKTKKQHLEASANIPAQMIASFSPGPSRTTVTLDARISTPATGCPNSPNPIVTPITTGRRMGLFCDFVLEIESILYGQK